KEDEKSAERDADAERRGDEEKIPEDGGLDISHENHWEEENSSRYEGIRSGKKGFDDGGYDLEQMAGEKPSLYHHLMDQIYLDIQGPAERLIAAHLMEGLDETGYFKTPLEEIAMQIGAEPDVVEEVLKRVQKF